MKTIKELNDNVMIKGRQLGNTGKSVMDAGYYLALKDVLALIEELGLNVDIEELKARIEG